MCCRPARAPCPTVGEPPRGKNVPPPVVRLQIYLAGNPAVAALRPATKKAEDTYLGRSVGAGNNVHGGITQVRSKTAAADSGRKEESGFGKFSREAAWNSLNGIDQRAFSNSKARPEA